MEREINFSSSFFVGFVSCIFWGAVKVMSSPSKDELGRGGEGKVGKHDAEKIKSCVSKTDSTRMKCVKRW